MPSWNDKLKSKNYQVTPGQAAINAHYLEIAFGQVKPLMDQLANAQRSGVFSDEEWAQIEQTMKLLYRTGVPVSMLDVQEEQSKKDFEKRDLAMLRRNAGL